MVRIVALLIVASVLYYIYVVAGTNDEQKDMPMAQPSTITVEELPPIRAENE